MREGEGGCDSRQVGEGVTDRGRDVREGVR